MIFLPFNPSIEFDGLRVDVADTQARAPSGGERHAGDTSTLVSALAEKGWRIVQITTSAGAREGVYALIEKTIEPKPAP